MRRSLWVRPHLKVSDELHAVQHAVARTEAANSSACDGPGRNRAPEGKRIWMGCWPRRGAVHSRSDAIGSIAAARRARRAARREADEHRHLEDRQQQPDHFTSPECEPVQLVHGADVGRRQRRLQSQRAPVPRSATGEAGREQDPRFRPERTISHSWPGDGARRRRQFYGMSPTQPPIGSG
jgi:hypothetical protein